MTKKASLTFTASQLFMLLDAMDAVDAPVHFDGNDESIAKYDDLYDRVLVAYRKAAGVE
jgi:hypothetical protein